MEEIKKISIEDKNYPRLLKKIKNPPKVIYVKGELTGNEKCFAVVGTRRCTDYGKQIAFEIAKDLAKAGFTIVSGLAPGIDTIAHKACLEARAKTIAVLGTGLDEKSIYPKPNLKLARKILETGGALISEYPPGTHGSKFTFPQRNRIISGISFGVLVVEARKKSGAIITAEYAFSQKRKVFAIPGSVFWQTSKGCHYLIKKGAKLVESPNDILEDFGMKKIKEKEIESERESEENLILKILKEGPKSLDEILEKTNFPPSKIASLLAILEIKGKVKNLGGNFYAIGHS